MSLKTGLIPCLDVKDGPRARSSGAVFFAARTGKNLERRPS
jgi:hypothetical protein